MGSIVDHVWFILHHTASNTFTYSSLEATSQNWLVVDPHVDAQVSPALARNNGFMPAPAGEGMIAISGRPFNVIPGTLGRCSSSVKNRSSWFDVICHWNPEWYLPMPTSASLNPGYQRISMNISQSSGVWRWSVVANPSWESWESDRECTILIDIVR